MKKIYLFATSILFSVASFAQVQYDIQVTMDSPASQSEQAPNATQSVSFTLTNNGPDDIPADTLWLTGFYLDLAASDQGNFDLSDGTANGVNGVILPQAIPSGSSISSSQLEVAFGGPVVFNTSTYSDGTLVGVFALGIAGDPNELASGDPNDSDNTNNRDNFIIKSTSSLTELSKSVKVYPNPATNAVNFNVDGLENGTVTITSVTGQEVVNTTIPNGTKTVDVSDLNNGIYIYTVRNNAGEAIKTNKLVIRK